MRRYVERRDKEQNRGWGVMTLGLPPLLEDRCPFCMMLSRAMEEEACVPPIPWSPRLARQEWRKACPALANSGITLWSNKMINEACTALRGENGPHLPRSGSRQVVQGCALAHPLVVCPACVSYRAFLHTTLNSSESHSFLQRATDPLASLPPSGHSLLVLAFLHLWKL